MDRQNSYAVIEIKGKQYKVSSGDTVLVDKLDKKDLKANVLLLVKEGKVLLGKPFVEKNNLKLQVLQDELMGEKIEVRKYRAKSRYKKRKGFRPQYTKLQVLKI